MKLVNCPICGTRCSADTEKCPECGFEIKQYFEREIISTKRKKQPRIKAVCAVGAILIIVFMLFSLLTRNTKNPDSVNITKETDKTVSDSTSVKEQAYEPSSSSDIDVSGVYSGDDHEILVLNSDGLAYYYCITIQYTELECPWYIKDDSVYIELSRLHCTIFAKVDEKELIFKSDSSNWNTELFARLDVEPEQYLTKKPSTNDPKATLNQDGTISYSLDGINYTLPKMFMDFKDEFDNMEDSSSFIDQDAQSDYLASAVFHKSSGKELNSTLAKALAENYVSGFYKNTTVSESTEITVAGHRGFKFIITGFLNKGFNPLEGYEIDGVIIILYNKSSGNNDYIMMTQTSNRSLDDTAIFEDIIKSAERTSF